MRPGGSSSSVVRSRSPKITMAAVRGIGVAVITKQVRVAVGALGPQRRPLLHAEAVLLVDHDRAERGELDLLGQQRVGPHHEADVTRRQARQHRGARLALDPAREQLHPHLAAAHPSRPFEVAQQRAHGGDVLLGQHLGRHHERALVPALHRGQQRGQRHHRLAGSHVPLQEAVHGEGAGHVGDDDGQGPALRLRQLVGQPGQEARHEGVARPRR